MVSFTRYDIPPVIFALLSVLLLILGVRVGIDVVITMLTDPNHSGSWIAICRQTDFVAVS